MRERECKGDVDYMRGVERKKRITAQIERVQNKRKTLAPNLVSQSLDKLKAEL